jgi:hypothetical protein
MNQEEFYAACAAIIGAAHHYEDKRPRYLKWDRKNEVYYRPMTKAGRRSGREPGNGRFPGIGLVRDFGAVIHVSLTEPLISRSFDSYASALAFLREVFAEAK